MKIVVVGSGDIGGYVIDELKKIGDLVIASRSSKEFPVDISEKKSIEGLFKRVGLCDHIVCTAGKTAIAPFKEATDEQFQNSIASKMMGQMNLVRVGMRHLNKGGSITLTTGGFSHFLFPNVIIPAFVNAALERFVVNVAFEMKNHFRINAVSPDLLKDSADRYGTKGFEAFPIVMGEQVGKAYRNAIESKVTGSVIRVEGR